ncbi:MAG TPA: hypothetical protein VGD64_15535 [Acidisarcina sp.]
MKKSQLVVGAMSIAATLACASNLMAYTPAETFYAAGSSAQFNTFALAAGAPNIYSAGVPALCGTHHWSKKNPGGSTSITLNDPRNPGSIVPEGGNIWIVWNDAAASQTSGGVICYYLSVDSIVGVRGYQAKGTISLPAGLVGVADSNIVPLLGAGEALPANIQSVVNGSVLNVGVTDIRPEDAKFATMRALTAYGTQITGRGFTGVGYGPFPIGTSIQSSQSSATANPVDFAIVPSDTDPVNSSFPVRTYIDASVGASPILVFANQSNTGNGHFGDGHYTNVNRFVLANVVTGNLRHIRDLADVAGEADAPIHVFIREPLSGTYNTMDFTVPNSREIGGDPSFANGVVIGQEANITPSNTGCTVKPCTVESGNPLYHIFSNGATRARVVGTGEMISTVSATSDAIGYAFWGYSAFQGKPNIKYMTVDGVDPLYSGPASNPNGVGFIPQCATSGGVVTSCPLLNFPNVVNGTYPIWSKLRLLYDPSDATNIATTMVSYAQAAANPITGIVTDFVPAPLLQVFRSHFAQVVTDSGAGYGGNNGFKSGVPETGGDMGGAVYTVQSELDYINDTGGLQQTDQKQ